MELFFKNIIGDSRQMKIVRDKTVHLVVTSPPYWHIKDYEHNKQIGFGQTLHEYLISLYAVWKECFRVLQPGRRLVINIGDQFARRSVYGRYKIMPLHAEIISQCENIGYDFLGSIIWQKKTTMNTSGGATIMGSYPYPPNGIVEIDYEHILIFKKPGRSPKVPKDTKKKSALSKEEWKEYFSGHWNFGGTKQDEHIAMFPEELPKRIIRMFSFVGETVLDPFLGSGTTAKVALENNRNVIGYEINKEYKKIIEEKVGLKTNTTQNLFEEQRNIKYSPLNEEEIQDIYGFETKSKSIDEKLKSINENYIPRIKDAKPSNTNNELKKNEKLVKAIKVVTPKKLLLDDGKVVELAGIEVVDEVKAREYLNKRVIGKKVFYKKLPANSENNEQHRVYLYLKNRIFINTNLLKIGAAKATKEEHPKKVLFDKYSKFENH